MSLFNSCFSLDRDPTHARVGNVELPAVHTGLLFQGRPVSKFLVESTMLLMQSRLEHLGFDARDGEAPRRCAARWRSDDGKVYRAELDVISGEFATDAPGYLQLHGFGLVGFALAVHTKSPNLRAAWNALLGDLSARSWDAIDEVNTLAITDAVARTLELADPQGTKGEGWLALSVEPNSPWWSQDTNNILDFLVHAEDFNALMALNTGGAVTQGFQGPQLAQLEKLITRRKHTILMGPPGTAKTLCVFEALGNCGFAKQGTDFQVFTGHDEVKSSDLYGGYQPTETAGVFAWMDGVLVRAMTANEGKGQPLVIEELTRMPRRAQNALITVLSDGYVVLNERPGDKELIKAGPDFVLIADMNVDPSTDDVELFGGAFASRVRKLWFDYPSNAAMQAIMGMRVPTMPKAIRSAIVSAYAAFMKKWKAGEVVQPISPRDCVFWGEELDSLIEGNASLSDPAMVVDLATTAAHLTWLRDVAGYAPTRVTELEQELDGIFRRAAK